MITLHNTTETLTDDEVVVLREIINERRAETTDNANGGLGPKPEPFNEIRKFFFFLPRKLKRLDGSTRWYWFVTKLVECNIDYRILSGAPEIGDDDWCEDVTPLVVQE
jgi:hypothetical protein